MSLWLTIGISGVTCGGKTTLSQTLYEYLSQPSNANVLHPCIQIDTVKAIHQDEYFLPENHQQHTWIEKLNHVNWDILTSLDIEKMCDDINKILGPNYRSYKVKKIREYKNSFFDNLHYLHCNVNRHSNNSNKNTININEVNQRQQYMELPIHLNILILEGFLILNHHFTLDLCDIKFHIHLPYEKSFERRIKRVYDPPDVVGYFEMCVWPQYEKYFKQIKDRNDIIKLNGEISPDRIFKFVLKCIKNSL